MKRSRNIKRQQFVQTVPHYQINILVFKMFIDFFLLSGKSKYDYNKSRTAFERKYDYNKSRIAFERNCHLPLNSASMCNYRMKEITKAKHNDNNNGNNNDIF